MTIKLGIIGLSDGNGHPYSWSAIFNGYDRETMETCGFPVIPQYLSLQEFPRDAIEGAEVTHVWTQSRQESERIAKAAKIANIVDDFCDMIGEIDALLLARDDAENHLEFAKPFLQAGVPVYIDKPLALTVAGVQELLDLQVYPGQIFSCSALRYAKELQLDNEQRRKIGMIRFVDATVPKGWDKYAIHAIDPILQMIGGDKELESASCFAAEGIAGLTAVCRGGPVLRVSSLGNLPTPISIRVYGEENWVELIFKDTFQAFRATLEEFLAGVVHRDIRISAGSMLASIRMVEAGRSS